MARVTVEDCVDKVESPYELVLVAKERTTQLNSGVEPTVSIDNDKNTVISLREIANENIKVPDLIDSGIYKLSIDNFGRIMCSTTEKINDDTIRISTQLSNINSKEQLFSHHDGKTVFNINNYYI